MLNDIFIHIIYIHKKQTAGEKALNVHPAKNRISCTGVFGFGPPETSYLHDNRSSDNMIHGPVVKLLLDIKVKVLLVGADGPDQLGDVVGIQSAGLRW